MVLEEETAHSRPVADIDVGILKEQVSLCRKNFAVVIEGHEHNSLLDSVVLGLADPTGSLHCSVQTTPHHRHCQSSTAVVYLAKMQRYWCWLDHIVQEERNHIGHADHSLETTYRREGRAIACAFTAATQRRSRKDKFELVSQIVCACVHKHE